MPYTPQTWHDSPATDTPITAARLTVIEAGIQTAQAAAEAAASAQSASAVAYDPTTSAGFQEENSLVDGMPVLQAVAATNVQEMGDYLNRAFWGSDQIWYLYGQRDAGRRVDAQVGANPSTATGEFIPGIAPNGGRVDASSTALTLQPATQYPMQEVILTGNATLTLPTSVVGAELVVIAVQDGTGSRTLAWAAGSGNTLKWPAATAPTQISTANSSDIYRFICTAAGVWRGYRSATDVR